MTTFLLPNQNQIWTDSDIDPGYNFLIGLQKLYPWVFIKMVDAIPEPLLDVEEHRKKIITDNILDQEVYYRLDPEFFGLYSYQPKYIPREPRFLMSCFINRICPVRQSWLYLLQRHHLLDASLITFNVDDRLQNFRGSKKDIFEKYFLEYNQNFLEEHEILKSRIPIYQIQDSLEQTVVDCKISLVIETYFDRTGLIAFSEKIFRQLQLPRPFVLFGHRWAIKHLRSLGFDVYDDWIDHSYDENPETVSKQLMILEQIKKFENLSFDPDTLDDFERRSRHNRTILSSLKSNYPLKLQNLFYKLNNNH